MTGEMALALAKKEIDKKISEAEINPIGLDSTLTDEKKAAPASVVGDKIAELKSDLVDIKQFFKYYHNLVSTDDLQVGYWLNNGVEEENEYYTLTGYIENKYFGIKDSVIITNLKNPKMWGYKEDKSSYGNIITEQNNDVYRATVRSNIKYIRVYYGNISNSGISPILSFENEYSVTKDGYYLEGIIFPYAEEAKATAEEAKTTAEEAKATAEEAKATAEEAKATTKNIYLQWKDGYAINTGSGLETENSSWSSSYYVSIVEALTIKGELPSGYGGIIFYDYHNDYISSIDFSNYKKGDKITITSPPGTKYMKVTGLTNRIKTIELQILEIVKYVSSVFANKTNDDELPLENIDKSGGFCRSFLSWGCIGDSLSSGEQNYYENETLKGVDLYEYSWGQYMARTTGANVKNFSKGGLNTKTFLESYAIQNNVFSDENKCQAYTIFLGTNDINFAVDGNAETDIDFNDYNNNADTFVGRYAKIIQKILELQPKAKIFCITPWKTSATGTVRNQIVSVCDKFSQCYLVDLYTYALADNSFSGYWQYKMGGHLTAIGYLWMAWDIMSYIDYIIRHNMDDFKEIGFIGTDYSYTN